MTRAELKQYRSLKIEIADLEKQIDKLQEKLKDVPEVMGKVTKSSDEFPYILEHVSVKMSEPKEATAIKERIRIKRQRKDQANELVVQIESFINSIPDSADRLIFDMVYLQGMKIQTVADEVGYTKGRISQKIKQILKD